MVEKPRQSEIVRPKLATPIVASVTDSTYFTDRIGVYHRTAVTGQDRRKRRRHHKVDKGSEYSNRLVCGRYI